MLIKTTDLRAREVVNIADGRRLGTVVDLDIDVETGRINAVILPGPGRSFWLFGGGADIEIAWSKVVRIGVDVILVDAPELADPFFR